MDHPDTVSPGMFTWAELCTSDPAAAKRFYAALFGWELQDEDMGPMGTYTLVKHAGHEIGGLLPLPENAGEQARSQWVGYVHVDDCDATVARAVELGGALRSGPTDIPGTGRMAALTDREGARFAVFADPSGRSDAEGLPPAVAGVPCWRELAARDPKGTIDFYTGLFGWDASSEPTAHGPYTVFKQGGLRRAGFLHMDHQWAGVPSHWMTYVLVDDCEAAAARAGELGAQVCVPPTDQGSAGRFSVLTDPTGAVFSVLAPPRHGGPRTR